MLNQFSEQMKKSSQPASDIFAANVKVMQAVSQQQTDLLSGMLADSISLMQSLGQQTEVKGMLAVQSVYAQTLRDRMTASSKTTVSTLQEAGQHFANSMKASLSATAQNAEHTGEKIVATPVVKKAAAKKTAPKKVVSAKPVSAPTDALKATAEKVSADKVVATKVPTANVIGSDKVTPTTAQLKVAKPLPSLSADNVRATPKSTVSKVVEKEISKESSDIKAAVTKVEKA